MKFLHLSILCIISSAIAHAADYSQHSPKVIGKAACHFNIATATIATAIGLRTPCRVTKTTMGLGTVIALGNMVINSKRII